MWLCGNSEAKTGGAAWSEKAKGKVPWDRGTGLRRPKTQPAPSGPGKSEEVRWREALILTLFLGLQVSGGDLNVAL